jgi:hypothetical protein
VERRRTICWVFSYQQEKCGEKNKNLLRILIPTRKMWREKEQFVAYFDTNKRNVERRRTIYCVFSYQQEKFGQKKKNLLRILIPTRKMWREEEQFVAYFHTNKKNVERRRTICCVF